MTIKDEEIEEITEADDEYPDGIDEFKEQLLEFSEIDRRIRELNEKIKPIREELKELNSNKKGIRLDVCSYMRDNEIGECQLPGGVGQFKYAEIKRAPRLTKQLVRDGLNRYFAVGPGKGLEFQRMTSVQKATSLFDYISEVDKKFSDKLTFRRKKK